MKAMVKVTLKTGVLDPQGKAIMGSLASLGFSDYGNIRQGKYFEMDIDAVSKADAKAKVTDMCEQLLANTVIEDYEIEIAG